MPGAQGRASREPGLQGEGPGRERERGGHLRGWQPLEIAWPKAGAPRPRPPDQCRQHLRPQEFRGHGATCESPSCAAGPGTPTPKPSVLCFQLLLCPPEAGAPPPPVPYSRQPPAVQVSFLEGQEGKHPAGSIPPLSRRQTASSSSGPALGWTARNKPRRRRLFSHGGWAAASHLLPGGRCLVGCWRWAKLSVPEAFRKVSPVSGGRDSRKPTHSRLCQTQPQAAAPPDKETRSWEDGEQNWRLLAPAKPGLLEQSPA